MEHTTEPEWLGAMRDRGTIRGNPVEPIMEEVDADPADRLLAATAAVYDLTLVTADQRLIGREGYAVLAN